MSNLFSLFVGNQDHGGSFGKFPVLSVILGSFARLSLLFDRLFEVLLQITEASEHWNFVFE